MCFSAEPRKSKYYYHEEIIPVRQHRHHHHHHHGHHHAPRSSYSSVRRSHYSGSPRSSVPVVYEQRSSRTRYV